MLLQTRLPGWQARANHSVTVCAGGIPSARSVLKGGEEPKILVWEFPPLCFLFPGKYDGASTLLYATWERYSKQISGDSDSV